MCLQVMKTPVLLHTALQTTLTCDALSLRFQLPPYGSTAPESKSSPGIARGVPTTPVLLVTSLWVVTLLRTVAASVTDRLAPLLGLGAVSSQAALGVSDDDAARFRVLESLQPTLFCIPQVRLVADVSVLQKGTLNATSCSRVVKRHPVLHAPARHPISWQRGEPCRMHSEKAE